VAVNSQAQREIRLVLEAVTQLGQFEVLHAVAIIRAIHIGISRRQSIAADNSIPHRTEECQSKFWRNNIPLNLPQALLQSFQCRIILLRSVVVAGSEPIHW
jgi:hypothetical protein